MSLGQKAERVLRFLLGLRHGRVFAQLVLFGFTEHEREEGWRKLKALTEGKLSVRPPARADPQLLEQLDEWENRWFPVASATLKTRFPSVHAWLFLNLTRGEGPAVVVSVGTFVNRVERMPHEAGPDGIDARSLLIERGLTFPVVDSARELLHRVSTTSHETVVTVDLKAQARAEAEMWAWYLEWSEIARVAIRDRKVLRMLGFRTGKRGASAESPDAEGGDEGEGAAAEE